MRRPLETLMGRTYDVIVIGGGINGAGIARAAARRGLSTALVEKNDFSSGTTSRSTRLIHGGLRYLEHGELGLVFESLREREALLKTASHLVRPLPFILPVYKGGKYGRAELSVGMILYDLLSLGKSLPSHRRLSTEDVSALEPSLSCRDLLGAFLYYDGQVVYPERLCLESVLAAKSHGAEVANYAEVIALLKSDRSVRGVTVRDKLTGKTCEVESRVVVNAAGPWVDSICKLVDKKMPRRVGGTKGSHLVIPNTGYGPKHALYAFAKADGRPFFIIPWRDLYLIGTTDLKYDDDLDEVKASDSEVDYLIEEANRLLATLKVHREDVLYTYSGVRPLPYDADGRPEASITRRHIIYDHERIDGTKGFISVVGGKLTTYRNLAEQVVDRVSKKIGRRTSRSRPYSDGAVRVQRADLTSVVHRHSPREAELVHLMELYGDRFQEMLGLADQNPELKRRVCPRNPDIAAQIIYAIEHEMAVTLGDIFLRRTGIGLSRCLGLDCSASAAAVMGKHFGWEAERMRQEINQYRDELGRTCRLINV